MSYTIPDQEPDSIIAGLTAQWKIYLADYLPGDDWILKYSLKKSGVSAINISSTDNGDDYHLINLTPEVTALYTTNGEYAYQAYVENSDTGEKYLIETGIIEIKPGLSASSTSYDPRTHARKVLDAINAVIEGRASYNQSSVKVGDKELRYYSFSQLVELREYYLQQVELEDQNIASANGNAVHNAFLIQFKQPQ